MVTIQDIKDYMVITDSSQDAFIQKQLDRCTSIIQDYCNNDFADGLPVSLEDCVIQLAVQRIDLTTRFKSGKTGEGQGSMSVQYADDIPKDMQRILNKYRKVKLL